MKGNYDLVIIYYQKQSQRIIQINNYVPNLTLPIITNESSFYISRKTKIKVIDPNIKLHEYSYDIVHGIFHIANNMIGELQLKKINLERDRINAIEDLWLDIQCTIETYKSSYSFNPLLNKLIEVNQTLGLQLAQQYPIKRDKFLKKNIIDIEIEHQLTAEGLDELYKRCYIMYSDISDNIKESENPYETLTKNKRAYFSPIFGQTGSSLPGSDPT